MSGLWNMLLGNPVARQNRQLWASTSTLTDLGQLVASWLQGGMVIAPTGRRCQVEPQTVEDTRMLQVLCLLNGAGFVTGNSQPGVEGPAYDGRWWKQIAAVDGFCDGGMLRRLDQALRGTDVRILAYECNPGWAMLGKTGLDVSWHDGKPVTSFGDQCNRKQIARNWQACSPEMIDVLCGAWQVLIYDPHVGRNSLWTVIEQLLTVWHRGRRR